MDCRLEEDLGRPTPISGPVGAERKGVVLVTGVRRPIVVLGRHGGCQSAWLSGLRLCSAGAALARVIVGRFRACASAGGRGAVTATVPSGDAPVSER